MIFDSLEKIITSVDKYISGKNNVNTPIIIDFQNNNDLTRFITHYNVGVYNFVSASEFCCNDEFPKLEGLLNKLSNCSDTLFVTGLSAFLKLQGEKVLRNELRDLLQLSINGRVIVLTKQCHKFLNFSDPRLETKIKVFKSNRVGVKSELVFTRLDLVKDFVSIIDGINNLPKALEGLEEAKETIYINTNKTKINYPNSYFSISELKNSYDILCKKESLTYDLDVSSGSEDNWKYALEKIGDKSWQDFADSVYINHKKLSYYFSKYNSLSENEKWLYFIALKLFGCEEDDYLNYVIKKTNLVEEFIPNIYKAILDFSVNNEKFKKYYVGRKNLICNLPKENSEISEFCKLLKGYKKNAIYYLTDITQREKEFIIDLLNNYGGEFERQELLNILADICPDFANYLVSYNYKNELLNNYFKFYNYQKLINKILPEFEEIVKEQANKREYNSILSARASCIEKIDIEKSVVFFVDALGIEYLGYISSLCNNLKLNIKTTVCRSELPSITSENKDFENYYKTKNLTIISCKEIDAIKHGDNVDYDYQRTKLPIHLIKELEIIKSLINRINNSLTSEEFKKAIIISDHGASRLAVIHETENIVEMSSRGEHSGRCCLKTDSDTQPEFATDAGDFWALANYDRFKGGRKACVEVHGGASLEEVCVPIIEITKSNSEYTIRIFPADSDVLDENVIPTILVSFRKKAAIKIFSSSSLDDVSIKIDGRSYDAKKLDNNFFLVEMPEIKRAKEYEIDVYSGANKIAEKLKLIVKKESGSERNIL